MNTENVIQQENDQFKEIKEILGLEETTSKDEILKIIYNITKSFEYLSDEIDLLKDQNSRTNIIIKELREQIQLKQQV